MQHVSQKYWIRSPCVSVRVLAACAITTDVCEYEEGKQYFPINFVWQETQCNTSTLGQLLKQGELVITQSPTPSHASFI